MKNILTVLLTVSLLVSSVSAYTPEEKAAADDLFAQGLFYGTEQGYELDRALNRQEGTAMLVRLLGRETAALNGNYHADFPDVDPWATGYVGYAQQLGLVSGYPDGCLGAADPVTPEQYLTFVLRALGYSDTAGDFTWSDPWALAASLDLVQYRNEFSGPLTRGGAVLISRRALDVPMKGTDLSLREFLALAEQTRQDAALTPNQIYRKAANAVFYLETFDEDGTPVGNASGFFIGADGTAVTNYHAVIDTAAARITTRDGEVYPVTHILYGSTADDVIVMRVSKTAESGSTVSAFSYLELGDRSFVRVGDPVYSLGAPMGLADTFASGIVSSLHRVIGGRSYFQTSAPISSGSSGGPLLNAFGKVVGITSASYADGQNLNLVTPVSVISTARYFGEGTPYAPYFAGRVYHITADRSAVTVKEGETVTVLVGTDYPFSPTLLYENDGFFTVSAQWGEWVDDNHVQLHLTGLEEGEAEITITFSDVPGDASLTIPVTVLPGDDAEEAIETGERD